MANDATTSKGFPVGATDALAEEIWSTKQHYENLDNNWFTKKGLAAEDTDDGDDPFDRQAGKPVMIKSEFGKKAGQKLNMSLVRQLQRGTRLDENDATTLITYTTGTTYAVGYEETMTVLDANIWLNKLKHQVAFDSPDIMQHRTSIKMEPTARKLLSNWLAKEEEEQMIDGFVTGSAYIAQADSLTSAVTHPHTYRVNSRGATADIQDTDFMSAAELRRMMRFCKVKKIDPITVEGEECFAVLMSSSLIAQLLADEEFQRVVAQAHVRGEDNPLISGSIGKFYNLYIFEYERARTVTNYDTVEQVMIMGSNALAVGYGSEPQFLVRKEDGYGDRLGRGIARIMGTARADWYANATTFTINQSSGLWEAYKALDEFDG